MGSTSVTYTTAPKAFSAAQQPLPTYREREAAQMSSFFTSHMWKQRNLFPTDLTITAHHRLLSSKHDVGGSLQPEKRVWHSETVAL